MNYFYATGVYAFSLGCLSFTWDAISIRPTNKKYLAGCILFDIGCVFFIIDSHQSEKP